MENFMYSLEDDIFDIDYYGDSVDYSDELASTGSNESDIENIPLNQCSYMKKSGKGHFRKVQQRKAANMRERRRMKSINDAFDCLRKCLPVQDTVERKLSKVDTLKLAMTYIANLAEVIKSSNHAIPAHQRPNTDKQQDKIILKCQYIENEFDPFEHTLLGHSLTWSEEKHDHYVPRDNKLRTKLWVPHFANEDDMLNIATYSTDFPKHLT
ncbi:PTF1A-like protein [Mya arenaria]|uniref:PTF1A-like protein n=2 Tax=Mya arenaria TaxID=6604 RepID=A0ABY7DGB9_MYAAR|nr:PTF1A-like protein [Mya arenaria]